MNFRFSQLNSIDSSDRLSRITPIQSPFILLLAIGLDVLPITSNVDGEKSLNRLWQF